MIIELSDTEGAILFKDDGIEMVPPPEMGSDDCLYTFALAITFLGFGPIKDDRVGEAQKLIEEVLTSFYEPGTLQ